MPNDVVAYLVVSNYVKTHLHTEWYLLHCHSEYYFTKQKPQNLQLCKAEALLSKAVALYTPIT